MGLLLCGLATAFVGWRHFFGDGTAERSREHHAGEPGNTKALPGTPVAGTTGPRPTDTRSLILEAGKGFPLNCLTTTVGKLEAKSPDKVGGATVIVPVTVRFDPERYKQFDQAMRPILERVAKGSKRYSFEPQNLIANVPEWSDHAGFAVPGGVPLYSNLREDIFKIHYGVNSWESQLIANKFEELGTFGVMLFDDAETNLRRMRWTVYDVDQSLLPVFASSPREAIQVTVRLFGEGGKEIAERTRPGLFLCQWNRLADTGPGYLLGVGNSVDKRKVVTANINPVILGAFLPRYDPRYDDFPADDLRIYPIGPFFYYNFLSNQVGGFSPEIRFAMPFNLTAEEVDKVKSIDCQLSFKKGESIFSAK